MPLLLVPFMLAAQFLGLSGCSTAKNMYVESKYDLCRERCNITYSKYEGSKLGQCLAECSKDKTIQ